MEQKEFIDLVAQLRAHQKAYFKTRDALILRKCKELERRVDQAISGYLSPINQPSLFSP